MSERDMRHIALVAPYYPLPWRRPGRGLTFVRALALKMQALGVRVTVICPEAIVSLDERRVRLAKKVASFEDEGLRVILPRYFSFGSRRLTAAFSTSQWTVRAFTNAVLGCARFFRHDPVDCCYGEFPYPAGYAAQCLSRRLNVPSFCKLGGSGFLEDPSAELPYSRERYVSELIGYTGVVTVARFIKDYYVAQFGLPPDMFGVFHNAADTDVFYPRDKCQMRKKYGLPEAAFIPALVGRNNHNKGALRLHSALDGLPGVKAMFIGEGMGGLAGDQVAMTGQAEHDLLPEYLSCADVFVLPSLREGCNNAIQEALACGLPVVSSDRAFNREILRPEFAVLIDPLDVTAIRVMVRRLKDDSALRAGMSRAALEFTRTHNLANRAKGIIHWMTGFLHDTNGSGERPGSTAMTDIRT